MRHDPTHARAAASRWGVCDTAYGVVCNCFPSSGVGFRGMTNVTIVSNPVDGTPTKIGRMTHYNNQIFVRRPMTGSRGCCRASRLTCLCLVCRAFLRLSCVSPLRWMRPNSASLS